jgi:hypothetical protein
LEWPKEIDGFTSKDDLKQRSQKEVSISLGGMTLPIFVLAGIDL